MRGPRRREFSKAIRKLKFHGSTVLEAAGMERQTHTEAVTHTLTGWCLGKLEQIMLTRFDYALSPGNSS